MPQSIELAAQFRTDLHSSLTLVADHNKQKTTERNRYLNCPGRLSQVSHNGVPHVQFVKTVQNPILKTLEYCLLS